MKFGIQIRQLRKDHPDSHDVSALLRYVKDFSIEYRNNIVVISVDDECIMPVGEPDGAVSTGVWGHNRSLVTIDGLQLQDLDHDFYVHGIVPSVAFFIDVPESNSGSFFREHAFITNKDIVTQPSHALRHAAKFTDLVRIHFSEDGHSSVQPIAVVISNGGPDYRVTFGSVKIACITIFRALDLDMLVCVSSCRYQSWQNMAEHIMSTLNLALQNVSLAHTSMAHQYEELVKNKNTLTDLREAITECPELHDCLRDSMSSPMTTIGCRFQGKALKDHPIR